MIIYNELSKHKKHFDIITNNIHYPIAIFLCSLIVNTKITPNILTLGSVFIEFFAIVLIFFNLEYYNITIVLLLQFGWILDLMDGTLARYKKIGFYDELNPSLKGYYFDAFSDHALKFLILGSLIYQYSLENENGWLIGLIVIIIHGITQTEHSIRQMILKSKTNNYVASKPNSKFVNQIVLLMNNIYIYYFIFILLNRVDLLLISFASCELILLLKRFINFSFSKF